MRIFTKAMSEGGKEGGHFVLGMEDTQLELTELMLI
jgi:hypothetical protein